MSNLYLLAAGLLLNGHSTDATQPLEPTIVPEPLTEHSVMSEKAKGLGAVNQTTVLDERPCLEFSQSSCSTGWNADPNGISQQVAQTLAANLDPFIEEAQSPVATPSGSSIQSDLNFAQMTARSIDRMVERTTAVAQAKALVHPQATSSPDLDFAQMTARSIDRMVERTARSTAHANLPKNISGTAETALPNPVSQPDFDFANVTARSIYRMVKQAVPPEPVQPVTGTTIAARPNTAPDLLNPGSSSKSMSNSYQTNSYQTNSYQTARVNSDSSGAVAELTRAIGPASGVQLFQQRIAALQSGRLFTRVTADSYRSIWANAQGKPSYQQWKQLLALEARAVSRGRGSNRVSVLLGDSLSLWFPSVRLPGKQFWLNQGISGDTSGGVLRRLSAFSQVRADTIYLMIGINDLRRGTDPQLIVANQRRIVRALRQDHPQAQIVVQSLLPTDMAGISNDEIRWINQQLQAIAQREQALYVDLYSLFADASGRIRRDFTTDGLHLNAQGYEIWQWALNRVDTQIASARGQMARR